MNKMGLGTYLIGNNSQKEKEEILFLREAINNFGIKMIDTAEMYGDGASEILIGKAISVINREKLFIIGKVLPQNHLEIEKSCKNSLMRLGINCFDLYLLHWREDSDLNKVVEQMENLVKKKLIKKWGVSNFDVSDMEDLFNIPNGKNCYLNQILYNIGSRGVEFDLIPWAKKHNVKLMAYSPLYHNDMLRSKVANCEEIKNIAKKHNCSIQAVMLAFVIKNMTTIFKTSNINHLKENLQAYKIKLDREDLANIEKAFPKPKEKVEMEKI